MKLLIKNGRILDPSSQFDEKSDLLVENGMITKISAKIKEKAETVIDARGCYVMPGFIDIRGLKKKKLL